MAHWGMAVDLGRCVGCQTCTIACKMENGLPPSTLWRTVLDLESGTFPDVNRTFLPLTCMQCQDPPCHDACPTTATRVREDGIVWIADDICIGCGSCVVACPYQARHLIPEEKYYYGEATEPEVATYNRERVGICTKCHFCHHKFDNAPEGVVPGEHPEYTPACSSSCIADAIIFGDLDNPDTRISRLIREHEGKGKPVRLLEHLETNPSVYYLNPPRIEPQAPRLQHSWHGLAVANFFLGTTGIGLYLISTLHGWLSGQPTAALFDWARPIDSLLQLDLAAATPAQWAGMLAPLLVVLGLLAVAAEAGRPFRGFNVLRNVTHSWMSRESAFAITFFVLAGLDTKLVGSPVLQGIAALAGLGVALSQGMIMRKAKGVPAWSVPIMPVFFVVSGIFTGCGAWLVVTGIAGGVAPAVPWIIAALVLTVISVVIWDRYLATPPHTPTFEHAVQVLRQGRYQAGVHYLGHAVPVLALGTALFAPELALPATIAAGLAMLAGGLIAKMGLILKASFLVDLFDNYPQPQAASGKQSVSQAA